MNVPYSSNNSSSTSNIDVVALENQINDLSNTVASIPTNVNVSNLNSDIQDLSSLVLYVAGQQAGIVSTMQTLNSTQTTMQLSAQNTSVDLGALISDVGILTNDLSTNYKTNTELDASFNLKQNTITASTQLVVDSLEVNERIETTAIDPADVFSIQGLTIDTGKLDSAYYALGGVNSNPARFKKALRLEHTHPSSTTTHPKRGLSMSTGGDSTQMWFDMSTESNGNNYLTFGWNDPATNTPSTTSSGWLQIWFVAPTVQVYGTLNGNNITINGAAVQTSDERIKTNIQAASTTDAYELARVVELKEYDYVDEERSHSRFGFIAQQVESVYPEAVVTAPGNFTATGVPVADFENQDDVVFSDKKQVAKDKMFQLLFAAFQEAQLKIEALEASVSDLKTRI